MNRRTFLKANPLVVACGLFGFTKSTRQEMVYYEGVRITKGRNGSVISAKKARMEHWPKEGTRERA